MNCLVSSCRGGSAKGLCSAGPFRLNSEWILLFADVFVDTIEDVEVIVFVDGDVEPVGGAIGVNIENVVFPDQIPGIADGLVEAFKLDLNDSMVGHPNCVVLDDCVKAIVGFEFVGHRNKFLKILCLQQKVIDAFGHGGEQFVRCHDYSDGGTNLFLAGSGNEIHWCGW